MAGAGKVSKNQRTSRPAGASGPVQLLGEQKVLIPLNGGKHAYVRVNGRSIHAATDSQAFVDAVTQLDAADRVGAELDLLHSTYPSHGWDATKARLAEAGVL